MIPVEVDSLEKTFRQGFFMRRVHAVRGISFAVQKGEIFGFLGRYAEENGKRIDGFEEDALGLLAGYGWPGNVRELENVIERAVVLCDDPRIGRRQLPLSIAPKPDLQGTPRIPGSSIDEIERFAILKTLEMCGGSTSKAAAVLGISSRKIQYKLHEYATLAEPGETDP